MKHSLRFGLYLAVIILLQLAVVPVFQLGRLTPQVVLAAVIWLAFYSSEKRMLVAAVSGGLFVDLYSDLTFGVYTLALFVSAAIVVFLINRVFPKEGAAYLFGSALVLAQSICALALFGGQWLLSNFQSAPVFSGGGFLSWYFFGQLLTTLVAGICLAYLSDKVFQPRVYER